MIFNRFLASSIKNICVRFNVFQAAPKLVSGSTAPWGISFNSFLIASTCYLFSLIRLKRLSIDTVSSSVKKDLLVPKISLKFLAASVNLDKFESIG